MEEPHPTKYNGKSKENWITKKKWKGKS